MTKLLLWAFIKNRDDVQNPAVRQQYGLLSGAVGIVLNLLLTAGKLAAGLAASPLPSWRTPSIISPTRPPRW